MKVSRNWLIPCVFPVFITSLQGIFSPSIYKIIPLTAEINSLFAHYVKIVGPLTFMGKLHYMDGKRAKIF